MEELKLIKEYQKEIALLSQSSALLSWDQQIYMPEDAVKSRSEQLALLDKLVHEKLISDELSNALKNLKENELSEFDQVMIKKLSNDVERAKKIPLSLVEELSRASSLGFSAWEKAKKNNDFFSFEPFLEKILDLRKQEAKYSGISGHPYNGWIDKFEEGMTIEKIEPVFEILKKGLIELLNKIKKSKKYNEEKKSLIENKEFPKDKQIELAVDVVKRMGLNDSFFRMDDSEHPFTTKTGSNDTRITIALRKNPLFSFTSALHEAGHALYECGYSKEMEYTSLEDAPSHGIHESQSRFWENMIGASKPFWKFYFDKFDDAFKIEGKFQKWYEEINKIAPTPIRTESDEIHYCLHIILRTEIEKGLIEGSIEVKDLPEIWKEKMKEYFGIVPETDAQGVLQDVHWSEGLFGYFPTYAIGTIYSAQIFLAIKKEIPEIEKLILKGEYEQIKKWLNKKIHIHGRKYLAEEIIKDICGEGLNSEVFLDYLKNKYYELYEIED